MDETIFKKEKSIEILKIIGLIKYMEEYQTNIKYFSKIWMEKTQQFTLKNIDRTRDYFVKEIKQN